MSQTLMMESQLLRAVATVNGKVRCGVFLYDRSLPEAPAILVESLNLTSHQERAKALERVASPLQGDAEELLKSLAAVVAAEQSKPRARDAGAEGPFPLLEPWEEPVQAAALLDEIRAHLLAYVVLPDAAPEALSLWVAHTFVSDVSDFSPYILVTSPVRECGKTTLLEVLRCLTYRSMMTGGITAAALYRQIERHRPTMLLDELDTRLRGDGGEVLRGVLNTGFQRGGKVTICVGDDHEARDFNTFCPKVLAGIGRVWDTVTSRSIPVHLSRASKDQLSNLRKIRGDRIEGECLPFRRRLARWAEDVREELRVSDAVSPEALGARQSDVWRPLLAIADTAGGHWPATAREAALALYGVAEEESDYGLLLLSDLRTMFHGREAEKLFTDDILTELGKMDERPWPEYARGDKPITATGLSRLLGRFGVRPKQVRIGAESRKGYDLGDLGPIWRTYLPPSTAAETGETRGKSGAASAHVSGVSAPVEGTAHDEIGAWLWPLEPTLGPGRGLEEGDPGIT